MKTDLKKREYQKPLLWLWQVSARLKWAILALLLVQIALAAFGVWQAWILRDLVDRAVAHDGAGLRRYALLLLGAITAQLAGRAGLRFFREFSRSGLENRFKARLFRALLDKDYARVTAVHSEEWMNRLTSDTVVVAEGITEIVPDVVGMAVRLTAGLWSVLYLVRIFTWVMIPTGIALAAFTLFFRRRLKEMHKRIQESDGRLRVFLSEHLSSLLVVRSFVREEAVAARGEEAMADHRHRRMRRNTFSNLCNVGLGLLIQGTFFFSAVYCARGIYLGSMTYGTFTAVLDLIRQIQNPFGTLSNYVPKYFAMIASAERLMEAESYENDTDEPRKTREEVRAFYREKFQSLGLRSASFAYRPVRPAETAAAVPRPVVLTDLNVEIRRGDLVAVTGPSGCGKSTLLKLLMCLYPLDSGERYLTSTDGEEPLTAQWRRLFAYVPQGNQLMSGTIRQVVSFGDDSVGDEQLWAVLKAACADGFVSELPRKLDTVLGERGAGLSEGQMQRLAVARAVVSGHPILLLDEATSSLDEATERQMLANLRAMTDATVLIVTHRPQVLTICTREIRMGPGGLEVRELQP